MKRELRKIAVPMLISVCVSSCARLPEVTNPNRLPVAATIRHVNCEMREAFYGNNVKLPEWFEPDDWSVSVELTMQADNSIETGIGYKRTYDYNPAKVLSLGLGAGLDQKGHRDSFLGYSRDLVELKNLDCNRPIKVASLGYHPLTGNLGIANWRDSLTDTYDSFTIPTKLRYGAQFRLVVGANAEPVLTLTDITKSFSGALEQTNDDTLSLAFTKNAPPSPPPKPIAVYIVDSPGKGGKPVDKNLSPRSRPAPLRVPRVDGVAPETQQRLDEIQNKGVLQRNLPRCRTDGLC